MLSGWPIHYLQETLSMPTENCSLRAVIFVAFLPVISSYNTPRNAAPAPKTTHNGTPMAVLSAAIPAPSRAQWRG